MAFPLSPSPNATPFIPPLHTPGARTPPAPAPVLPPSSNSGGPSWGHNTPYQRTRPSLFPTAHSPAGTPYIPPGSGPQLMPPPPGHPPGPHGPPPIPMMPGGYSGGYFQQTPHTGQSGAHQPLPQVSAEWVGFGQTPASAPHTPYTPAGPPPPHGGAHFGPPPQGYGSPYYGPPPPPPGHPQTPYHHPGMGMGMGGMGGMGGPPPGWGPAGATPYHQPAYMQWNAAPSPWMGPPGGGGGPMYPPPGMGMGPGDGFFGGAPQPPASLARATVHVGDRVPPFTPGKHYGPALEPTLIKVLKVDVQLNPLLTFPDISTTPDDAFTTLKYLKWNMLFESSYCQLSTDAPNASWSTGRNDPATWPKLTSLKVTFHPRHSLPWTWVIKPKNPNHCLWVTCGDVIDGISAYIQRPSSGAEYSMLPLPRQRGVSEAYRRNRMVGHDVPGGRLGEGLRKLDWLGDEHIFGGLERPDTSVGEGGVMLPCTFVIRLERNYVLERGEGGPGAQQQREREGREGVIPRVVPE